MKKPDFKGFGGVRILTHLLNLVALTCNKKPHIRNSNINNMRNFCSRLGLGDLTAHTSNCLSLLRSRPDEVHNTVLHKTKSSSLLTNTSHTANTLISAFTPAIADCRFRAPLTPQLVRIGI